MAPDDEFTTAVPVLAARFSVAVASNVHCADPDDVSEMFAAAQVSD